MLSNSCLDLPAVVKQQQESTSHNTILWGDRAGDSVGWNDVEDGGESEETPCTYIPQ